jgi:hypothetical protein
MSSLIILFVLPNIDQVYFFAFNTALNAVAFVMLLFLPLGPLVNMENEMKEKRKDSTIEFN